ncbi:hypothetical protein HDU96_006311 [Phlyctochytrium bullatum]|nr:hypothetical protein HDU96_006311 [Phlyctochytrium bullatum]
MLSRSANALRTAATTSPFTARAPAAVASVAVRSYTNIRDAGGAFGKKEAAQEDKFVHDHDKELIKKLKTDLEKKASETAQPAAAPAEPAAQSTGSDVDKAQLHPIDSSYGGSVRAGGGALGKKEALHSVFYRAFVVLSNPLFKFASLARVQAVEEKYFKDLDKEKLEKMKKK